jgi:glucosylceramidase
MFVRLALFACLAISAAPSVPAQEVHLWLTTSSRSAVFARQPGTLEFSTAPTSLPVIDVNDMQHYQSIEGFGVALTGGSAQLLMAMSPAARTALLHELFDSSGDGIHLSYLRVSIGSSDMNDHAYTYDDMPPGGRDPELAHFSLDIDRPNVIAALKEILAINPRIPILGSPWSSPAWMKSNDALKGGHLKPENYQAYAQYFVKYIQGMAAEGISIRAITVQNEPLNPKNTPSLVMFAPEETEFIAQHLGPAFAQAGITTAIQVYDHNADAPSYPLSILGDPVAGKYVAGSAMHLYGGDASVFSHIHDLYPNKDLFLTEQSVTERPHSPTLGIDAPEASVVIDSTRNWCRNVLLWNLAADPNAGPHTNDGGCDFCYGAVTLDGDHVTRNVAYYVLAHASKFVPPESLRVGSNTLDQMDNVAFLTPDGHLVLIVANTGNFPVHFAIRFHGKTAEATLPEESVGTFVW